MAAKLDVESDFTEQFLSFLARDIKANPGSLQVLDSDLRARAQSLVGHVEVDIDALLSADDE